MKILVYGSKGWIGKQFLEIIKDYEVFKGKSRLYNIENIEKELNEIKPTHVFSFIGRTHGKIGDKVYSTIDYLEQEGKLVDNIRDNLFSPINLSKLCEKKNIHLTYLGTGCIFKFDEQHPFGKETNGFTEDSKPNFFSSGYSVVKGFTDQMMTLFPNVLNLRIRMPITEIPNPRNFITKMTKYEKICSIPNSMTVLPELLPMVLQMAKDKVTGTINLTNPGLISHNEMLEMYKEIVDPQFEWKNFTVEEQSKILAAGRSNNYLDTSKLQTLFPNVKNIKESVREMLHKYKVYTLENKQKFMDTNKTNLLITGGCGFIGSNFINLIMEKYNNINIINIDAMYYCANELNIHEKWRNCKRYTFIKCNLCDYKNLKDIFEKYNPTHIIHFAAQSHVQNSFNESLQYTNDNVVGTHTLLEVSRIYNKIQKFIHVSTDEVYGESMLSVNEKQKTEHSILCPTNPYAATKAGAELIAQSYCHSFNMPIVITRGNNVYGPNQYPEKVIPKFIKQLKNNEKVTIQGNGSCVRAFLHSYDTATAFQTILEKGNIGEIYNIGCDENMEYSILNIAQILIKYIQKTENYDEWISYIEDRPFNDQRYYISNNKLKKLGWKITKKFSEEIQNLINTTNNYDIDNKNYLYFLTPTRHINSNINHDVFLKNIEKISTQSNKKIDVLINMYKKDDTFLEKIKKCKYIDKHYIYIKNDEINDIWKSNIYIHSLVNDYDYIFSIFDGVLLKKFNLSTLNNTGNNQKVILPNIENVKCENEELCCYLVKPNTFLDLINSYNNVDTIYSIPKKLNLTTEISKGFTISLELFLDNRWA